MTRRWFIGGMAAAAVLPRRVFADFGGTPRLKFGIVSDIHIHKNDRQALARFEKALNYFKSRGADAVMIPGDMSDNGTLELLVQVGEVWDRVFGGTSVEKLFVYGNHDVSCPANRPGSIAADLAKSWETAFHEPYAPVWYKEVKGYSFTGAHWYAQSHSPHFLDAMRGFAKRFDPSKPFFFTQHAHVRNTCLGDWAWGADDGTTRTFFEKFPNAVTVTGHSHDTLTDERSLWQGEFTALNAGSLSYSSTSYNLRANAATNAWGYKRLQKQIQQKTRLKGEGLSHQGLFVTVTDEAMRIERREFEWDQSLGPDWVVPLPLPGERPFAFAAHAKRRTAPEFPADAKLSVSCEEGVVKVAFPPAEARRNCRVFEYELIPYLQAEGIELPLMARRVIADDYNLPASKAGQGGVFEIKVADLPPEGRFRFEVRPLECLGLKGAPISSAGGFSPRDTAPMPTWTSVSVAAAGGDFAKVDWSKVPEQEMKVYPNGLGEPAKLGWKWGYRLANDGEWVYLELLQHRDSHVTTKNSEPGVVISPEIACFDTWELTVARQRAMPYRHFLCGPDGRMVSASYGEVDGRLGVDSKASGTEHWGVRYASDCSSGDLWRARWALPLKTLTDRPLKPGDVFYLNPASVLHPGAIGEKEFGIFSPVSYSGVRVFDRMVEIVLANVHMTKGVTE